ncbi:MAG TPA: bifunctional 4-hydroxy-2-oxoglutarate aldolase/2-dehydro-3-deoxy-phosphogluconate aldolase [Bryobacteraceae bacterium]|nr:bifunctional 4-hydroxy-2-oxoglutarate aldolase/2-dehydro-3-deoxy-phosphogluconate aldolase [Bryobacteraceae bacterium]
MERGTILAELIEIGIVPVIRAHTAEAAIRSVDAIWRGGIRAAEITMTVPRAISVLERAADEFGDRMVVGAGTVLDPETAHGCVLAGAAFFVTPSLDVRTIEVAKRYSKVIMPGALTPTEVLTAWEGGGDAVRIVPCDALGGAKYIRALRGPFPHIQMVATGGVRLETIGDFLYAGACAVGVSGALVDIQNLRAGHYEVFTERARRFRDAIQQARESMPLSL